MKKNEIATGLLDEQLKSHIVAMAKLQEIAKQRHPHSNDILRWGQEQREGLSAYRICNICERDVPDTSFDRHYRRTKKSEAAEWLHIQKHLAEVTS